MGEDTEHAHASERYDRPIALLRHDVRRLTTGRDLVTLTEVQSRRAAVHRAGWRTAAGSDLAVMWRRDRWRLVRSGLHRLAAPPADRAIYALVVVLDPRPPHAGPRVLVSVSHLPSAVQWGDRFNARAPRRVAAWRTALAAWHGVVRDARRRHHPGAVLTVADWNVDLRRPVWRAIVRRAFPTQRLTWNPPYPVSGTHAHGRIIDATATTESGRARLLPRTAASDHRAYSETIPLDGPAHRS